ncbi:Hypothetical protein GLP15_1249 [Giardia lamblia P15]|uniref:Asteroid domain-containing protein n=1 Tax=Giardia intestinalis (strain P15) TaxID=658858 RepID=E1EZR2_GIAIA|nr:Hypothetical protein GLP15_1249 [Giardia lamblia P15]
MVIRNLTSFVNNIQGASTRESLIKILTGGADQESSEQLSRGKPKQLRIAIDGDSLFYYLYMQKVDWLIGGDGPFFTSAIKAFIDSLARFNITPVIFVPPSYISTTSSSQELKKGKTHVQYMAEIARAIEKDSGATLEKTARNVQFYPLSHYTFIEALRTNKVQFRVTDGPVIPYICSYAKEKNVPVIAYDTVYYAHDIPCYIHCDSITFKQNDIQVRVIRPSAILRDLELSVKQFQLVCRLLPSDFYVPTVLAPFRDMVFDNFNDGKKQREGADIHVQRISALVSYVKGHANAGDDASSNDYAEFFANVQELNAKYYNDHKAKYSKRLSSDAGDSGNELAQAEVNDVEELLPTDQEKVLEILHNSARMFSLKDYKNSVKLALPDGNSRFGTQVFPDWIETFLRQGLIPPTLVFAINLGFIPLLCGIEAVSGSLLGRTSACLLARQLRVFSYSLLGLSRIDEQFKHGEEWVSELLDVPLFDDLVEKYQLLPLKKLMTGTDISYIEKFPNLTGPVRRELVLLVLLDGDSKLVSNLIERFSKPIVVNSTESDLAKAPEPSFWHTDVFILACIIYMLRHFAELEETCGHVEGEQPSVSSEMLATILTAAYLPLCPDVEQANPKRSACNIDIHMLTLASALQFVYEAGLMVNSLFGRPLDIHVTELHRGLSYLLLYHEERRERNSQLRKYNLSLTDPNTPFYQSTTYNVTEKARREKNYTALSKQDKYICTNIEKYERLRLVLITLSLDVLPTVKGLNSSSAMAITKLTDGSYVLDSDLQTLPLEARFYMINQEQKQPRKSKKREASYNFTELRSNHQIKASQ